MKTLSASMLLVLAGAAAQAQTPPKAPSTPPSPVAVTAPAPRIVTEFAIGSETSLIKGQPFSAEAVSESVQTLADGNRITRKWTSKLYRDSQGRFRREGSGDAGSALGAYLAGNSAISIIDPAGSRYYLNTDDQTARVISVPGLAVKLNGQNSIVLKSGMDPAKIQAELKAQGASGVTLLPTERALTMAAPGAVASVSPSEKLAGSAVIVSSGNGSGIGAASIAGFATATGTSKYETRTESLGTQDFEGVMAEGTRTTTTIPADAIGNERPIEIVYERWYSKDLGMLVYSKHSDPRFGEQTYRLTNINRNEPDPSLFEVPPGYKVVSDQSTTVYRTAPRAIAGERTAPARVYTAAPATKP